MNLELMAMRWLRWQKRCPIVLRERSPIYAIGDPDVLGVTAARYLIEIEIKRSVADFKADARKAHVANRSFQLKRMPKQKYYFVTREIVERCKLELPEWAGLMTVFNEVSCRVLVEAPVNKESQRLTVVQFAGQSGDCG